MKTTIRSTLLCLSIFVGGLPGALASESTSMSREEKVQLARDIGTVLKTEYIFPEQAQKIAASLLANAESGKYDKFIRPEELSQRLTTDIRAIHPDVHLSVAYSPAQNGARMIRKGGGSSISPERLRAMQQNNFGFKDVQLLAGNIGYINLTQFVDPTYAGETAVAAMAFLTNSDAIIFDLRENPGGAGEMYQLLISYLFDEGPVKINEIYWPADDRLYQTWTLPHVPGKRRPDVDVYVLTSANTASAAEVFSYSLKHLNRATVVGEATLGAANPVSPTRVSDNFMVWLSKGQAINPVTKTNWEGKGVIPHIETSKQDALHVAHINALEKLANENRETAAFHRWNVDIVKSQMTEVKIANELLKTYAGQYVAKNGTQRGLVYRDGTLFYQMQGVEDRKLMALSETTFMLPGENSFKVEIIKEGDKTTGLKRMFDDGYTIQHIKKVGKRSKASG